MKESCLDCFKNLSIDTRFKIYEYLKSHKKACVSEVTDFIKLKQPTVSYHLHEMENSGLLTRVVDGKHVYFSINSKCPHDGKKCIVTKN